MRRRRSRKSKGSHKRKRSSRSPRRYRGTLRRYRETEGPQCKFATSFNGRDILCLYGAEYDSREYNRCYYRSKSQGVWRIAMLQQGSLTFEKGDDYTQTTLVHPSLQEYYTTLYNQNLDTNTINSEIIRICQETYTRLHVRVNDADRKLLVLSSILHSVGDLPFANDETIQRLRNNAVKSPRLSEIVRSECISPASFADERHLLLQCINDYLDLSKPVPYGNATVSSITIFNRTGKLHSTAYTLTNPVNSQKRCVRFYTVEFPSPGNAPAWRRNKSHKYVLSAVDEDRDKFTRIGLMNCYIPIGLLGQKPYEYVQQAKRLRTVERKLDRSAREIGDSYRFFGDLTSALWPNNDWSLFNEYHVRRDLCNYTMEQTKHISPITKRVLAQPKWLNEVMAAM